MAKKKWRALDMIWADIPSDKEEDFNRWYNEEHLAEVLSFPGVLSGARYVAVRGGPKYLTCYEMESPEVMETEELQRYRASPSEWSKKASPRYIGTNYMFNVYGQIYPTQVTEEVAQSDMAPALQIGRMEVPPEVEDEFNEWYNTIYVPDYEKVPGCIRGRRYIATRGEPKYLTVYEFEHERVSQSPEWAAAREAHPDSPRIRSYMVHAPGSPGVYKKIFQL